ncbi:MAG: glycosyltransferase [Deltaproteobacteria bacterium]|nr:glycosyltransferase [Deltaproteobacteria bacterium]
MIVKDEEVLLRDCLLHAQKYCPEMIVVDTGSTDRTKAIAADCGALVLDFQWTDDFAAARNFACSQSTGDWILMLDADERLAANDWQTLVESIQNTTETCFDLCQINYTNQTNVVDFKENDFQVDGFNRYRGYTVSWLTRLFNREAPFRFSGVVHEHLTLCDRIVFGRRLPVYIHHHGQALAQDRLLQKKKHYLRLGEKKVNLNPLDYKACHEAGIACWELGDHEKAGEYFKKSYNLNGTNVVNLIALGTINQILKKYDAAETYLKEALTIDFSHSSVHAALGRVFFEQRTLKEALSEYKQQIKINPDLADTRIWLGDCYTALRIKTPEWEPTLTVCYITKNEADCLPKTLQNVKSHAHEIIVVDTGSTDGTKEIAKQNGAFVCEAAWRDDFAWARNQSLKHATSEWVLVLDADEVLSDEDWVKLKALINSTQAIEIYLLQTTYSNQSAIFNWKANELKVPEAAGFRGYFESPLVRLFKNTGRIRFRGAVHEHAFHEDPRIVPLMSDIRIHHYGKWRDAARMKDKSALYHKIGIKKLSEMPREAHAFYEMAIQLWEMEETEAVEAYLLKALELDPNYEMAGAAYACFLHFKGRLADSIDQFVKVIKKNPHNADAHLFLSSVLIEAKKYDMALQMIAKARELGFKNEVTLRMNEGVVYLNLKEHEKARQCYLEACAINPEYGPLLINLGIVSQRMGDFETAIRYLNRALNLDGSDFLAHKYLGETYFNAEKKEMALDAFMAAHQRDEQSCAVKAQIIITAHCLNKTQMVIDFENKLFACPKNAAFKEAVTRICQLYQQRGDQEGLQRITQMMAG